MDPVNGLNQIMQVLRQRLGNKSSKTEQSKSAGQSTKTSHAAKTATKPSSDEILRRIGDRVRALSPEEKRGNKAMQIFVESVLVWEFGEELLQDPKFTEIANEVHHTINENAVAREKLVTLLTKL